MSLFRHDLGHILEYTDDLNFLLVNEELRKELLNLSTKVGM